MVNRFLLGLALALLGAYATAQPVPYQPGPGPVPAASLSTPNIFTNAPSNTTPANTFNGTVSRDTAHTTTAASGDGVHATISAPITCPVGAYVTVAGVTPVGYNATALVTASVAATSVTYANATTGAQTIAGTATCGSPPMILIQPAGMALSSGWSTLGTSLGINTANDTEYVWAVQKNSGGITASLLNNGNLFLGGTLGAGATTVTTLNASSTVSLNSNLYVSPTAPTIANGGGLGTVGTITGSSAAFDVTAGTGAASVFVITLPTAANGWVCHGNDVTTHSTTVSSIQQTVGTNNATTVTMGAYSDISVLSAVGTGDHLRIGCVAY